VLVKDYLKRSRRLTPALEMTADQYINQGYQTLLNYEIRDTGGFDWHGNPPANLILSAYGLLEFHDMAKVFDIDTRVIERAQRFVLSKQKPDGSWDLEGGRTAWSWRGLQGAVVVTSYVTWALAESKYKGEPLQRAIKWLKEHGKEAQGDLYALSLMANAFAAWDGKEDATYEILKKLDDAKKEDSIDGAAVAFWSGGQTLYYAKGQAADVESTALAVYALLQSPQFTNTVNKGLTYLTKMKQSNGTWGSTQATILALKSLLKGMSGLEQKDPVDITFELNGKPHSVKVTPDQADVMQLLDLKEATRAGDNELNIRVRGETSMMYQVVTRYYLPWNDARVAEPKKPVEIDLSYDRTTLTLDDTLTANVKVRYNGERPTFMVIVSLGLPPGFVVDAGSFAELLGAKKIDRYEVTARHVRVYLGTMEPGKEFAFSYGLRAKYPIRAKTPKSEVYEYYTPENRAESAPVEIEVRAR
jgi:hypothetical protein